MLLGFSDSYYLYASLQVAIMAASTRFFFVYIIYEYMAVSHYKQYDFKSAWIQINKKFERRQKTTQAHVRVLSENSEVTLG